MVDRCNRRRVVAVTWKLERWRVWPASRYDWHVIMCANRKFRKRCVKIPSNQEPQNGLHRFYFLVCTLTRYNEEWRPLKSPPLSLYFSAMSAKMRILALGFPSHNSLRISREKMQELHSSFQSTMLGKLQPYVQCRKKTNPFIKKSFTVFETHPKKVSLYYVCFV